MLLQDIIAGTLKSSHVLILDTAKQKGDQIINAILARHMSKPIPMHVLCFERDCSHQQERLGKDNSVVFHDFFSDPRGWLSKSEPSIDICEYLCSKITRNTKIVLWIDSLSSALVSIDNQVLYKQLQRLLQRSDSHGLELAQLVSTLHVDVENEASVQLMSQTASTVIKVQPPPEKSRNPLYSLTHHKPNGKIFKETRLFNVGEEGKVTSLSLAQEQKVAASQPSTQSSTSNPVHDTFSTFRHGLSSDEQKARDNLVLPFERLAMGGAARGQGRIEYEPEEADEWDEDEEDPDDDLEV